MALLFGLLDLVLLGLVALDTLGFLVQLRKRPESADINDYKRLCFTWVFLLAIRSITCCSCSGILGNFICMLSLLAKAYVSIPMLRGTDKLYNILIEQNYVGNSIKGYVNMIKQKLNPEEKTKTS